MTLIVIIVLQVSHYSNYCYNGKLILFDADMLVIKHHYTHFVHTLNNLVEHERKYNATYKTAWDLCVTDD